MVTCDRYSHATGRCLSAENEAKPWHCHAVQLLISAGLKADRAFAASMCDPSLLAHTWARTHRLQTQACTQAHTGLQAATNSCRPFAHEQKFQGSPGMPPADAVQVRQVKDGLTSLETETGRFPVKSSVMFAQEMCLLWAIQRGHGEWGMCGWLLEKSGVCVCLRGKEVQSAQVSSHHLHRRHGRTHTVSYFPPKQKASDTALHLGIELGTGNVSFLLAHIWALPLLEGHAQAQLH